MRHLAKRAGVTLSEFRPTKEGEIRERLLAANGFASEYYHYLLTEHKLGKKALDYLHGRGITDDAIETFKLGWAPEGWGNLARYLIAKKGFTAEELVRAGLGGRKSNIKNQIAKMSEEDIFDWFRRSD